jgi:hypothetical protein
MLCYAGRFVVLLLFFTLDSGFHGKSLQVIMGMERFLRWRIAVYVNCLVPEFPMLSEANYSFPLSLASSVRAATTSTSAGSRALIVR